MENRSAQALFRLFFALKPTPLVARKRPVSDALRLPPPLTRES